MLGLQVDLVVCYDAHASPIRDLQRCGRTGRQRGGRVVQLLALGREELSYEKQQLACSSPVPFCVSSWMHARLCSIFRYLWQRALQCLCGVSALARLWLADLLSCHSQAW